MGRKIRCISIDGMERTGKTSVIREMRKFLKNKDKDFHEINGSNLDILSKQKTFLDDNENGIVLKENGVMSVFHENFKNYRNIKDLLVELGSLITEEKNINHQYGVVNFFLLPEDMDTARLMFGSEEIPSYYNDLVKFYKGINQTSITQGLDIRLIPFNENDRIFDVRDKILEILKTDYEI
jgi:hypothetical protein